MHRPSLAGQAEQCRAWAQEFIRRPEGPILLRIAHEFDHLAAGRAIDHCGERRATDRRGQDRRIATRPSSERREGQRREP